MVSKLLSSIQKRSESIHSAALILIIFSFISQFLGLIRDRALVSYLGPSLPLDVYYAAFRIPDIIYATVASLVAVTAIMPFLKERLSTGGTDDGRKFLSNLISAFSVVMLAVVVLAFILMPLLVPFVAPGFPEEGRLQLITMSRVMLLSPLLLGFQNLFASITQYHRKFFIFALAPVLYNLGLIAGIVFLYPMFGTIGLAWGVVLGALLHLLIHLVTAMSLGYTPHMSPFVNWKEIRTVAATSFPRTITLTLAAITVFFMTSIASTLNEGSISLFTFAINIATFPIGLIGLSFAVAAFPTLVDTWKSENTARFLDVLQNVARHIIFWSLPLSVLFIVLRAHIVRVVYGTINLSWTDTKILAATLAILAVSITSYSLLLLFIRAYYAAGQTRKPFWISLSALIGTIVLTFTFLELFQNSPGFRYAITRPFNVAPEDGAVLTLAMAYTSGYLISLVLMWRQFRRDFGKGSLNRILVSFSKTAIASIVGGVATYGVLLLFSPLGDLETFTQVLTQGFLAGLGGAIVMIGALYVLKSEELMSFVHKTLKRKVEGPVEAGVVHEESHI
jgi:putative peptidoglycan lipid II flippase